ncbi:MAG: PP2C family protein-serine/threonine phosphatase [Anaerolineales bacterium]|jgi:serine phosphatase RsbU (regulator of sigma subunit)
MDVQIAVAKVKKYATSESGDTVEIIERPAGGISVVLADGQSSGRGAKRVSNMVARKAITMLADGVRDGAAARAASDFLFTERSGKVSATLNILSVDLITRTLVATRNNSAPTLIFRHGELFVHSEHSTAVGLYRNTRPQIIEIPLEINMSACIYTDGLVHAGKRVGTPMNTPELFSLLAADHTLSPDDIANQLLQHAIDLDQGRPSDDISVVILRVCPLTADDHIRTLSIRLPIQV